MNVLYQDDVWRITREPMNVVLYKMAEKVEGKERKGDGWRPFGFYRTISECLHRIMDEEVNETVLGDLEKYEKIVQDTYDRVSEIIDNRLVEGGAV